jgi:hypothetical protein
MPRLVHLVRASSARTIERAGIRGGPANVVDSTGRSSRVERAVFAMPLVPDFSVSYQWVRELRRWHGERMMAVHFVLPSDEEVLVGRYNAPHERLSVRDAVRQVLKSPAGNEIIVIRSVRRREVVGIRNVTQLVGWTEIPESGEKLDCVCQVCVPAGTRDLMRRLRGEFARHLMSARKAKSHDEVVRALQRLDTPLERAHGRIPPDKLLGFARVESGEVRRALAWLLGHFRWSDVEDTLLRLVADPDERVSECAIESLVRAGGTRRAYGHVRDDDDAVLSFIDHLEYGRDVAVSARLLSLIAMRKDERVRARASRAAAVLLRDDDLDVGTKHQLQTVAAISTGPSASSR